MSYDYLSLYPDELKKVMEEFGVPAFRAAQLFRWMHVQLETDPEKMSNIPASLRKTLAEVSPGFVSLTGRYPGWTGRRSTSSRCPTTTWWRAY